MRLTRAAAVVLAFQLWGCEHASSHDTGDSARAQASVPAYLQPIFHSIDSLLPGVQRDSLRRLALDSGFTFRAWHLDEEVKPLEPGWIRSPVGDSVIAHGEKSYMTSLIVLDLYQQHLRSEPLDLAGALRRVSPEYVQQVVPHTISIDSVLLDRDMDGNGVPDHFVREVRRQAMRLPPPVNDSAAATDADTVVTASYKLVLYLNAAATTSSIPAWSASFDERNDGELLRAIALSDAGTLLVIGLYGADASESVILLVRQGQAQEILRHQIDDGEGDFKLRDADGRVAIDVTGDAQLGGRTVSPTIQCAAPQSWPGSTLIFNDTTKQFVVERSICIPRTER
ncbi:MAG: hypothetical protein ACJ796_09820 [Gemmatimonadaceae bacterium]